MKGVRRVMLRAAISTLLLAASVSEVAAQTNDSIWSRGTPLLEPYSEIAVAGVGDRIYVLGGYSSSRVYVDTVQVYDALADRWDYTTPLPPTCRHSAITSRRPHWAGACSSLAVASAVVSAAR
jgi:Kelch motif